MKIINDKPTNQIFISLMDYRIDHDCSPNSEYGFGYFELDDYSISKINHFHDNYERGKRDDDGIIVDIRELFLINESYMHEQVFDKNNPNLKGIKLDSINFIESKPVIGHPNMIKGVGSILVRRRSFSVQCKDIEERGFSYTIFQSIKISYWKINHLLNRKKPI